MTRIIDGIEYPPNYRELLDIPTLNEFLIELFVEHCGEEQAAMLIGEVLAHQRLLNRVAQLHADARRFAQLSYMVHRSPKREQEYQRLRTRLLDPRKRVYREEHDHGNK